MKRGFDFLDTFAEGMDLPGESLPGQPIVELAGETRVLIENHFGVCQYSREKICVNVKFGQVAICGRGLELARMTRHQIAIRGCIDGVSLVRRGK